jgi:hypothetical protein
MRFLGLLLILAFFTTCQRPIRTLAVTPNGYKVLPKQEYSFKDTFSLADTGILSTTAIYSCCRCKDQRGDFLKFFKNGTVAEGKVYPVDSTRDSLYYTTGGYYTLHGNVLKIELPDLEGTFFSQWWQPIVYTCHVNGDTIAFVKTQWYGKVNSYRHMSNIQPPGSRRCDFIKSTEKRYFNLPDY